jgi:hypothetical protein
MSTIEDELRAVLDGYSRHGAPPIDRTLAVEIRIKHHQRVRTASLVAVLAIVMAVAGGVLSIDRPRATRHVPAPAATVSEAPTTPGHLPTYENGGKIAAYVTATLPEQTTFSITYTPTSYDFQIGSACAAPGRLWLAVFVNGHPYGADQCDPAGSRSTGEIGTWDTHEQATRNLGITLGEPMTIRATVGTDTDHKPTGVVPTSDPGVASIGVYAPVSVAAYHFPPAPASPEPLAEIASDLPNVVTQLGPRTTTEVITMPKKIQVNASATTPGTMRVYVDGTLIDICDFWDYGGGYGGIDQEVGTGRLAGITLGERVTVTVEVTYFKAAGDWQMTLNGS